MKSRSKIAEGRSWSIEKERRRGRNKRAKSAIARALKVVGFPITSTKYVYFFASFSSVVLANEVNSIICFGYPLTTEAIDTWKVLANKKYNLLRLLFTTKANA